MLEQEYQLPTGVEEQARLAEELHGKLFPVTPETPQVPETPEIPVTPQTPEVPVVPVVPEIPVDDEPKFRDRYNSLKGKYDAEVPRLAAELRELKAQIAEAAKTPVKPTEPVVPEVDEELAAFTEKYGEDFVNTLLKLTQKSSKSVIQEEIKPIVEQHKSAEERQLEERTNQFIENLNSKTKGWEDLWNKKDEGFNEFLNQSDPSGLYTYGELLQQFNLRWDADKMATIFNTYLQSKEKAPVVPVTVPNPIQDALIAPNRQVSTPIPVTTEKKIWTNDTIEQFKRDDRKGIYSEKDSESIWNDLLAAGSEGRIR